MQAIIVCLPIFSLSSILMLLFSWYVIPRCFNFWTFYFLSFQCVLWAFVVIFLRHTETIYASQGSGFHARSGMSPVVLMKIWNT
jgi:hypothetical protein